MNKKLRRWRKRIVLALVLFALIFAITELLPLSVWLGSERNAVYAEFVLYLIPYAIAGYDVLLKAARNIKNGQVFDENFLMAVATIGAFSLVFFPDSGPHMAEGAAVMLFYQVGELFQQYAVGKSRKSIAAMMDIAPDFANVRNANGDLEQVDPDSVAVGSEIIAKPGERVPIDGIVVEGFGVGGLPEYEGHEFYPIVQRAVEQGKIVVMTTQVPNEGSDLSVYHVGGHLKNTLHLLEAFDMTTEAAVCKLMWILGQTREFEQVRALFNRPVAWDILTQS